MNTPRFLRRSATVALSCLAALTLSAAEIAKVSPTEAAARAARGEAVIVDVREADEWKETGIVANAHPLALSDLRGKRTAWKSFLEVNRGKEIILYCRSGGRSSQAATTLAAEGFKVANAGGLSDWTKAGLPVRKLGAAEKK